MRDFNQPLRTALYQLLNGQLTYEATDVPVFDGKVKKGSDNNYYVLIGNTSSIDNSTFGNWSRKMQTIVDIVTKTTDTATTDIADNIAGQVLALLMPDPSSNGLSQGNFQYLNVFLVADRYLELQLNPTTIMLRRLLTISITANQIS